MSVELQATIAQGAVTVAAALIGAIAGSAAASTRRPSGQPGENVSTPDPATRLAAEAKQATDGDAAAVTDLQEALAACESPRQRLLRVADTATATAEALTRRDELGLVAGSRSITRGLAGAARAAPRERLRGCRSRRGRASMARLRR